MINNPKKKNFHLEELEYSFGYKVKPVDGDFPEIVKKNKN
jgi:hypothetical protein